MKIERIEVELNLPDKSLWFDDYEMTKRIVIPGESDMVFAFNSKDKKYKYSIGIEEKNGINWTNYSKEEIYAILRGILTFGTIYGE